MKKIVLLFIVLITLFFSFACNKKEDEEKKIIKDDESAIENVMMYIEVLPEKIKLKDEKDILYCQELYNALSENDKSFVSNYDVLLNAIASIKNIKDFEVKMTTYLEEAKKYIEDNTNFEIDSKVKEISLVKSYEFSDDGKDYTINILWISEDPYTLSSSGLVTHKLNDVKVKFSATLSCNETSQYLDLEYEFTILKKYQKDLSNKNISVGYFNYNSRELNENEIKNLDIINYAFCQITKQENAGKITFDISANNLSNFGSLANAKENGIRLVVSLGGWHTDSSFWDTYSLAASTDEYRKQVADALYKTLQKYDLDGVDIDWEYPQAKDRENFTLLVEEIRKKFDEEDCPYLITMAIPGGSWVNSRYDLVRLQKSMDYYYIMSYDFDSGTKKAIYHSSIYNSTYAPISLDYSVNYLINLGISKDHILAGAGFYGRRFTNVSTTNYGLGSTFENRETVTYDVIKNTYYENGSLKEGIIGYYDKDAGGYLLFDTINNDVIVYDSKEIVKEKCAYVKEKGIKGLMFWSMNCDNNGDLTACLSDLN